MKRMYEKKDEGSMGIGALIIFIALVLVAAIAAAVIIQTAAKVRDDATHTSDRISAQFLGLFNVISVYGHRSTGAGPLDSLVITTRVVSTANVDLRHIAITVATENRVVSLVLSPDVSASDTTYAQAITHATSERYSVYIENLASGSPWDPPSSYNLGPNDIVAFVINITQTGQPIYAHSHFSISFVNTYTGAISKVIMTTPPGYGEHEWIKIYPPQ